MVALIFFVVWHQAIQYVTRIVGLNTLPGQTQPSQGLRAALLTYERKIYP